MTAPSLPDFDRTVRLSQGNLDAAELSECHGLLCGLLCREAESTPSAFMQQLAAMKLLVNPGAALSAAMTDVFEKTVSQLEDEELGFELWLPDDDESIEERTVALAQWCSGFLAGIAIGGQLDTLSDEASEAIGDLQQIARAEMSTGQPDETADEEDERAYMEIVEYVRVVALMMREDFRGPGRHEAIH